MGSHYTVTKDLYLYIGAWRWHYNKLKHVAHVGHKYNKYRCVRRSISTLEVFLSYRVSCRLIFKCVSYKTVHKETDNTTRSIVSWNQILKTNLDWVLQVYDTRNFSAGRGWNIQRKLIKWTMENVNNCTGQIPSSEADTPSVTQQIPRILHNSKAHYPIHPSQLPVSVLSQINPVHATVYFSKMCFNIILPSTSRSSKLSLPLRFPHQNLYALLLFPYVSHAPSISFLFTWSLEYRVRATNYKTNHDAASSTPLLQGCW
jgi:hypothetical protein